MQTLCQHKVGWDEPLNDDLSKDLKQSAEYFIERCYFQPMSPNPLSTALLMEARKPTEQLSFLLITKKSPLC